MDFPTWFARVYMRPSETRTAAMARLHVETGVSPMSIRRAVTGTKVRTRVARRLSEACGGEVPPETLTSAPTASEARAA